MDALKLEPEAEAVALELLDRSGEALISGDFDAFASCFALPKVLETSETREELADTDELRALFDRMHEHYRASGVTRLIRYPVSARFCANDEIEFVHETHLMSGDRRLRDPYRTRSRLRRHTDGWRGYYSSYAVDSRSLQGRALTGPITPYTSAAMRPDHDKETTND